jgi:hypothetical protein
MKRREFIALVGGGGLLLATKARACAPIVVASKKQIELVPAPGPPPILQEPVHVDVGEQWARDTALRRAARVALATTDAPGPVTIMPFLDRRFQPQLDQPEHTPVHNATSYRFQKLVMWNRIEESSARLPITVIFRIR